MPKALRYYIKFVIENLKKKGEGQFTDAKLK